MTTTLQPLTIKYMKARFPGTCAGCGRRFPTGTEIVWEREVKAAWHDRCHDGRRAVVRRVEAPAAGIDVREPWRSWTGEKAEQWKILEALNEFWDGEYEIAYAAAQRLDREWAAGTWETLERPHWLDW